MSLDEEVAEHVMEWTPHPNSNCRADGYWRLPETRASNLELLGKEDGPWDRVSVPKFSSDIAAAFQVVEKMRDDGWFFEFCTGPIAGVSTAVFCTAVPPKAHEAMDDSAPLAICRAALMAVESTKGKDKT